MPEIDPDDLTEAQMDQLLSDPETVRMLEYADSGVAEIAENLQSLFEADDWEIEGSGPVLSDGLYSLFVEDIADRSGRVTPSTVHKVLQSAIDAYADRQ